MNIFARLASLPLRIKLILLAALGVLLMVIITVRGIAAFDTLTQPAAAIITEVVGRERADQLTQIASRLTGAAQNVASDQLVQNSLQQANEQTSSIDTLAGALDVLRGVLNQDPTVKQIHLTAADGRVILTVPDINDRDDSDAQWFNTLQTAPLTGNNVYVGTIDDEPAPTFDLVAQVNTENGRIGYVVLSIDPEGQAQSLASVFSALNTVNYTTGSVVLYLVDNDTAGTIDSPFAPAAIGSTESKASVDVLVSRFFTRAARLSSPLTGQSTYLFVSPITPFGKWLVAESRTVQVAAPTDFSQFILPQIGLVALGIGLLAVYVFFLESAIVRPVHAIQNFARRVSEGRDLGKVQRVDQQDEIGDIASSLNTLSTQLFQNVQMLQIQLAESVRDIEATREIGQIISSLRDLDTLLTRVVELIRQRFPHIYHAQVFLVDETGEYAELRVATALGDGGAAQESRLRTQRVAVGSRDLIGRVTSEGRPLTGSEGMVMPFSYLPDTRAELVLPLRNQDQIIGALDLHSQQPDAFAEEDLRLFQSVADQLAIAIVNAQLFEQSQARLREIEVLNRQFLGVAWRSYSQTRRRMQATNLGDEYWSPLQRQAFETGEMAEQVRDRIVTIAIPVKLRGVVLGAVEVDLPLDAYSDSVRQLALELTNRLAVTADNARLFEQTVRATEREALINEISSKLTQQTEVSEILQIAVRELGQALRVPQAAIRLNAPKRTVTGNG